MFKIGITGGIGSGKSLVSEMFRSLGAPVYNADSRAKFLMNKNADLVSKIISLLGSEAYDSKNELNKVYIASRIFEDPDIRSKLNEIVHPAVNMDYKSWMLEYSDQIPYILKEAAIIFETGSNKEMDKVICVTAPEEIRIARVMNRDKKTRDQVKDIIAVQMPQDKIITLSDFVIQNDGLSLLIPQVLTLHRTFVSMHKAV